MIVFFEKAMITGYPLQNKLRTYKKNAEKHNVKAFFQSVELGPPTAKPDENFLDPRMDIRYRAGRERISLLKTFYNAAKISNDHVYICLFVHLETLKSKQLAAIFSSQV